mgnify:FL=1
MSPIEPHLDPDIAALIAIGERAGSDADAEHLQQCRQCADEVDSLRRAAEVGRSAALAQPLLTPAPEVWDRISTELGFDTAVPATDAPATAAPETVAPEPARHVAPRRSRRRRMAAVLFAGIGAVVAASLILVGVWVVQRDARPTVTIVAAATLEGFPGHPGAVGEATLQTQGDGMRSITVTLDADVAADGYREVWLLAADGTGLISLGVLDGRSGTFPVPADADLERYSIVDISQERSDGDPGHSGDSIVRGALESS